MLSAKPCEFFINNNFLVAAGAAPNIIASVFICCSRLFRRHHLDKRFTSVIDYNGGATYLEAAKETFHFGRKRILKMSFN